MDQGTINRGLDHLASRDRDVAAGLDVVGYPAPRVREQGFPGLLEIIAAQQISAGAAAAIRARLAALAEPMPPDLFLDMDDETLRATGLSRPKIAYARGIARAALDGRLDPGRIAALPDDAVVAALVDLKGVGRWTAEVYMLFALGRRDIFPADDLALQEGLKRLKRLDGRPDGRTARELVSHWAPWRGVGALFLWHYYKGAP